MTAAALELVPRDRRALPALAKRSGRPPEKPATTESEALRLKYRDILYNWLKDCWGETTAQGFLVLTDRDCGIEPLLAHRMLHAMLPTDRPTPLDLPAVDGPRSYKKAVRLVGEAARVGRITTAEAKGWQQVLESEYTAWVRELSSRGLAEA